MLLVSTDATNGIDSFGIALTWATEWAAAAELGHPAGGRDITGADIIAEYLGRTNATGGNVDAPAI